MPFRPINAGQTTPTSKGFRPMYANLDDFKAGKKMDSSQSSQPQQSQPQGFWGNLQQQRGSEFIQGQQAPGSPLEKSVRGASAILGGAADVLQAPLKPILPLAKAGLESRPDYKILKQGLTAAVQTEPGEKLISTFQSAAQQASQHIDQLKKEHPRAAADLQALFDIVNFAGTAGGVNEGISMVGKGISGASAAMTAKKAEQVTQDIIDMSRPVLNKSETATAISQGQGHPPGLFSEAKVLPTARDLERAKAIEEIVDPSVSKIENVNKLRSAVAQEGDTLSQSLQQNDVIFNRSQFSSKLKAIEPELEIQADPIVAKKYELAQQKFMKFVEEQPKKLSGLLKARKNFDIWVEKNIPKIWDDGASKALNNAMKDMRNTANSFIEEKLPTDELGQGFRSSLKKQNLMYESIDNMSEQAVKDEMKQTGLMQKAKVFSKKHPIVTKAVEFGAAGAAVDKAKDYLLKK